MNRLGHETRAACIAASPRIAAASLSFVRGGVIAILVAIFTLAACSPQDPTNWYPKGTVNVVSFTEAAESGVKLCSVTLKLSNSGLSKIRLSTVSISVTTSARTYFATHVSTVVILPGKSVYATKTITYADTSETTELAKITIVDQFYE